MINLQYGQLTTTPIVIALGFFDCMHLGHQKLLVEAKRLARQTKAKVAMFTFCNNHLRVIGKQDKLLYTYEERLMLFDSLGVDVTMYARFDEAIMQMTAEQFVVGLSQYALKGIVCGFDYTCGCDRKGYDFVKNAFPSIPVVVVSPVTFEGQKVSSTEVRELLLNKELKKANFLLSENYFLTGQVVSERQVGTRIGFPTANINTDDDKLLPSGVYSADVSCCYGVFKAIVNIGQKPTFGLNNNTVEVHLLDFEGNLYGKCLKVSLKNYLRDIKQFPSSQELTLQLQKDRESAKND